MNFTITDCVFAIAILYFFFRGWNKGFLRTILGPFSLVIGCAIGFIYYQKSQNLLISLLICMFGPLILNIYFSLVLRFWRKTVREKDYTSLLSRLLGGAVSIVWSGSYLVMFLILIGLLPMRFQWFEKIQNDVVESRSYHLVKKLIKNKVPQASVDIEKLTKIFNDPATIEQFQSTPEYKVLVEDERLKAVFTDEAIAEQIRNKEYSKLLTNPEIKSIFQDQDLLDKIFALNKRIMEEDLKSETAEEQVGGKPPRVIDIKPKQ